MKQQSWTGGSWALIGWPQAIRGGVEQSINPCAVVVLLLFIVFLYFLAKRGRSMAFGGGQFILGLVITKTLIDMGALDRVFGLAWFDRLLDFSFLVVSIVFLILGVLFLHDWKVLLAGQERKVIIKFPFVQTATGGTPKRPILQAIKAWGCGVGAAFMISAWPAHKFITILFYEMMLPGREAGSICRLLLYNAVNIYPLVLALIVACVVPRKPGLAAIFKQRVTLFQAILAAVFTGVGIVVLRYYI